MALPKQIQAQADALAAFEQQAAQQPKPDEAPEPSADPAPETPQASAPAPAPQQPPADDPNSLTWQQRYRSLQGQFNADVPRYQAQITQLTEAVAKLSEQLKAKDTTPEQPKAKELVTKQDVDAFGEDLIDVARRIATEEFGKREAKYEALIERLQSQLAEAKGQVGEVAQNQAATAQQQFFASLGARLPQWQQVQATPECQQWLASRVPGTRASWNDALNGAASEHDVDAVMEVFDAFFTLHPALKPGAKPAAPSRASQELQRQVAPSKAAASAATPQAKRVYTSGEYASESMRQLRLMQQGKHDEAAALEAELNAAIGENRIRP